MPRTCYIWDGDNVAAEVDENGDTIVDYTYMPKQHGELVSQRRWDGAEWQTRYHQYDALGSTIALTDETGAVTDTYTYDAWGNEIAPTSTFDNPFRWVGKYGYYWNDDLRYYYVRARDYTPLTSRWLSRDPLGLDLDANPYRYVGNGPATLLDASGLSSVCGDANVWYSQNLSTLNDLAAWNVFTVLSLILVSDLKQEIADANLQGKVSKFKHTGGFIIPVANGNETGIYASYAFFIAFDICETAAGDVHITLDESSSTTFRDGKKISQGKNEGDVTASGDVKKVKLANPVNQCKDLLVFADSPSIGAPLGHTAEHMVNQKISLKNGKGDVLYKFEHTVTIKIDKAGEATFSP